MGSEPDHGAGAVQTSVGYLLMKAGVHFHAAIDDALAALGLTGREFLVLTFVGGEAPLSQQDLSRRLGLDPTIVVGLIDSFEERGLATRQRDPADRRRYVLSLTPKGRKAQTKATAAVRAVEADFLGQVAPADQTHLRETLLAVMRSRLPWLGDS